MNFTPRMVALDIDGTLVDATGAMPNHVHAAVRRVVDAGIPVVLSTGRWWPSTRPIFDLLALPPGWAVSSNGAKVVHYPPCHIVVEHRFDPAETIRKVSELAPQALIAVEDGMRWRANKEFPDGELEGDFVVESLAELASRPVSRIVIREPSTTDEVFLKMAEKLDLHEVSYFIGWSAWMDIAPEGIDKAHGLQYVSDQLGIQASDVLAVGDGRNDVEMLQWAGRGVAMGNAPDDVKEHADHVTGHFDDAGLAQELLRWF